MSDIITTYNIPQIPDATDINNQHKAGGNFITVCRNEFNNLLHTAANQTENSLTITIRLAYNPKPENRLLQSRLKIYLITRSINKEVADFIDSRIQDGPLGSFYTLKKQKFPSHSLDKYQLVSKLHRKIITKKPSISHDLNDQLPEIYFEIQQLIPNLENDWMLPIQSFDRFKNPFFLDISIEPVDITYEREAHQQYLSHLSRINRTWDHDDFDDNFIDGLFPDDIKGRFSGSHHLNTLKRRDATADVVLRNQEKIHSTLYNSNLLINVSLFSISTPDAKFLESIIIPAGFKEHSYHITNFFKGSAEFENAIQEIKKVKVILPNKNHLHSEIHSDRYSGLARLKHIASIDEISGFFRLPIASSVSPCCIQKNTDPPEIKNNKQIIIGMDYYIRGVWRSILLGLLTKGWAIFGVPGSGKTYCEKQIILQLMENKIPFLAIEPVKTEIRDLLTLRPAKKDKNLNLIQNLEIYSPGNEHVSPLRFNPFQIESSAISTDEHIDSLMACLMAVMPVYGPMPAILRESLDLSYDIFPDRNTPPTMRDFVSIIEKKINKKKYSEEIRSNLTAAIETRLNFLTMGSVGKIFQCNHNIPSIEHLLKSHTLIEFNNLEKNLACTTILFILTALREHFRTREIPKQKPWYVIIIDETHLIAGNVGPASISPDAADTKAFTAEYISQMIAELRGLGVGIILLDQSPSTVTPQVIKSMSTVLAFKQLDAIDRQVLANAMLFGEYEYEDIARLLPGEGYLFTEGFHKAIKIVVPEMFI